MIMEWISVKDRLPEDEQKVLVCKKNGGVAFCEFDNLQFFWWGGGWVDQTKQVTHWMPLPEPPQ